MTAAAHAMSVDSIEGIGKSFGARLRDAGVSTILELLAARTEALASLPEVPLDGARLARWRSAARLMLLPGVTAQFAEALVRSGIQDAADLASARLSEMRAAFQSAHSDHIIPEPPTDDDICAMILDAAVHANTGHLSGIVETADGDPVGAARVRLGKRTTITDAAGRFHMDRLPLGRGAVLHIVAATGGTLTVEKPQVITDPLVFRLQRFRLPGSEGPARVPRLYSELAGDRLPRVSAPLRIVRSSRARVGDVLRVSKVDERAERAVLVSLFRSYFDGTY